MHEDIKNESFIYISFNHYRNIETNKVHYTLKILEKSTKSGNVLKCYISYTSTWTRIGHTKRKQNYFLN